MKFGNMVAGMYKRLLRPPGDRQEQVWFPVGPRQTGKSTLVRETFPDAGFCPVREREIN
jgi:predicted AAA+ superfamily ATPase